jgi:hypothetical protein
MRAAIGRRDGVAIPAIGSRRRITATPQPIRHAPWLSGKSCVPAKKLGVTQARVPSCSRKMVGQAAGKLEHRASAGVRVLDQRGIAFPADFDAAEQIGLRPRQRNSRAGLKRHPVRRSRCRAGSDGGAAPVVAPAPNSSSLPRGMAAREASGGKLRLRATSTTAAIDSAFTTETPTPCSPPEVA